MTKYDDDRDEIIRPLKKSEPKPKKPKADHKHEYEEQVYTVSEIWRASAVVKNVCKICGKEKR